MTSRELPAIVQPDREWKFTQWFRKSPNNENGGEGHTEESFDITSVEFDDSGNFLATGTYFDINTYLF